MTVFLWNLLLALAWAALQGRMSPGTLATGFVFGYLVLLLLRPLLGPSVYFAKVRQVVGFILFYLWELVLSNLRVALTVLDPELRMRAGVVAIPLEAKTDAEITLLANLITMTPGTLSLDVSADRRTLYIHAIHFEDLEQFRQEIKRGLERRVLEVLR
jgi:multicomponent Na+:H+ antiporter subunit E